MTEAWNRKWINPSCVGGVSTREYEMWSQMKMRCTEGSFAQRKRPSYVGTILCEAWKNYDTFFEWMQEQQGAYLKHEDEWYVLEKDLLSPDNKLYSPENCVFVPRVINSFICVKRPRKTAVELPIGVSVENKNGILRYKASCYNPFDKSYKNLGRFTTQDLARATYVQYKKTLAKMLADKFEDTLDMRVIEALRNFTPS